MNIFWQCKCGYRTPVHRPNCGKCGMPNAGMSKRIIIWWRKYFGNPPTWSFSFAHWSAAINKTPWQDEFDKERAYRQAIRKAWYAGEI